MRSWLRAPLFWILLAAAALRLAGLFWGLPGSDGWDDDGFAPRNFLTALALTWKPGSYFTYPPLHALLLAIPNLPVAAWALAHAPSLSRHDVIATMTQPQYMTFFAVTARLVSIAMSLGIIWTVGAMARLVAGRRAGLFASGACALNMGLVYYGQVSNLDVPYLFWAGLALLALMRAITEQAPRQIWWAALLAAAAVATKDQAYAVFAFSLPVILLLWFAADAWPRANARRVITALLFSAVVAIFLLLLVDGAVTNPSGFARRLAFLTGPASADWASYAPGMAGKLALLADMAAWFGRGPAGAASLLALLGLGFHVTGMRGNRGLWVAGLLPVLAIISFTLCFNFAALRSDDRFLLPQAIFAAVYIGIAAEQLVFAVQPWLRIAARAALAVLALLALHQAMAVNAAMLLDPRYDAESWMRAHVKPGDTIETYGQNCFLPRFPRAANVTRVGPGPLAVRNPLPGVTEIRAAFGATPRPRLIVVSARWAQRYMAPKLYGQVYAAVQQMDYQNGEARRYFAGLVEGAGGFRLAHAARYDGKFWPVVHIHDSLDEPVWIFERTP